MAQFVAENILATYDSRALNSGISSLLKFQILKTHLAAALFTDLSMPGAGERILMR